MLEYRNNDYRDPFCLRSVTTPQLHNSTIPLSKRVAWTAGLMVLLCISGCTTPFSKPPLSVKAQAEAFSHFSLGLLAEAAGDSVAALEHLESAIRIDPSAKKLYPPAVSIALKLERPEDALRLALRLNAENPNELNTLLLLARVYVLTDHPAEAETVFNQVASEFPETPEAHLNLSRLFLSQKQFEKALVALENARTLLPEDLMLARQVLELSIQSDTYDHALELSETLPEETGKTPEAWLQFLAEKTPPEHREKLIEYLEGKLQEKSPHVFYYTLLSSLYLDDERTAKAKTTLQTALVIYPDNDRLRTVLGHIHLQEENYDDAYATFNHVRTHSPDSEWVQNPFFAFNFIIAAQKSDHLEEAVATLASTYTNDPVFLTQYMHSLCSGQSPISIRSAIDLLQSFHQRNPTAIEALYYLTLLQTEEEEFVAALENAREFEALAQNQEKTNLLDGFFYYQYASLYERTGQLEAAEKLFFKAIELGDPVTVASAQNYIAYMWAERGEKLEFGLNLVEQALSAEPENAAFIDTRGWIYYMQGRYQDALIQLKTACKIFSGDASIWEHLGDTYLKLGNPTAARKHWKKALELSPELEHLNERIETGENVPYN